MKSIPNKNSWHSVDPGKTMPEYINSIIEISMGSNAKYGLDKESGLLRLDCVLFPTMNYPANYGFIPQTIASDNDPLDIFIISSVALKPLSIIEARVIGLIYIKDDFREDEKIISVAKNDTSVNYIKDLPELPFYITLGLNRFFEDYKKSTHEHVQKSEYFGREHAYTVIEDSLERYNKQYNHI